MATTDPAPASRVPIELEATPPEVKRYEQQKLTVSVASLLLRVAVLAVLALVAGPRLDAAVRTWTGDSPWVRVIVLGLGYAVLMELLQLPLAFYAGFILEHRYGLSTQTLPRWAWQRVKAYVLAGVFGLAMLLGLYVLLWYTGPWWWLWATAAFLAMTLVLGRILPVLILPLFYKVTPLDDAALLERLQRLAQGTGLTIEGVYRLDLSSETRKGNAALTGLGRTRRVLLGDTLLDELTPEEIEVVFAHEVGHHVYRHLAKRIAWSVVMAAVGFGLVDLVLRHGAAALGYPTTPLPAYQDPAALPLLLLVLTLFNLVLMPLENAVSRFFERQCDRYALERTRLAAAYRSAFTKLARMNKTDPDPHPLVVWLFDDHPPIRERLALADLVLPPG
jgi:STE24 endopeptidase